jgi:hypothetical protein
VERSGRWSARGATVGGGLRQVPWIGRRYEEESRRDVVEELLLIKDGSSGLEPAGSKLEAVRGDKGPSKNGRADDGEGAGDEATPGFS